MISNFNLTGKIIAITGGYGYLGKAVTESLLYHGATVWVLGLSREKHDKAFESLITGSDRLFFSFCDIAVTESIRDAFERVSDNSGKLDVLINNAFYMSGRGSDTTTDEDWEIGVDGILSSVYRCIREAIPHLGKSNSPGIINVASTHGMMAPRVELLKPPQYGAAKAGVIQLTRYFASYLGDQGIRVNTITPGPFPSDLVQKDEAYIKILAEKTYLKRIGRPEELAGTFVFLVSDASGYITGQNIVVDGGFIFG